MQSVYINRKGLQSVEIEEPIIRLPLRPGGKATLDIDVVNYEAPTHIYLSSRGAIKDKVTFNRNNPYVDGEELLTITVANPPGQQELYEGEVSISTGYGSREGSFILQIGQLENEPPPDSIEVDDALSRMDYRSKARPARVWQHSPCDRREHCADIASRRRHQLRRGDPWLYRSRRFGVLHVEIIRLKGRKRGPRNAAPALCVQLLRYLLSSRKAF